MDHGVIVVHETALPRDVDKCPAAGLKISKPSVFAPMYKGQVRLELCSPMNEMQQNVAENPPSHFCTSGRLRPPVPKMKFCRHACCLIA